LSHLVVVAPGSITSMRSVSGDRPAASIYQRRPS